MAKDQALKPGELYRVTTGDYRHTTTLRFLNKVEGDLLFELPHSAEDRSFKRRIHLHDILNIRKLDPEEVVPLD